MTTYDEVLPRIRDCLGSLPDIRIAYVFGSQVGGAPGPLSDIDIAVVLENRVPVTEYLRRQIELAARLRGISHLSVDVIILNEAPPLLAHRVISKGRIVLCRDETFRVRFETRRLTEYMDTRCLDQEYDRALTERIRQGQLIG